MRCAVDYNILWLMRAASRLSLRGFLLGILGMVQLAGWAGVKLIEALTGRPGWTRPWNAAGGSAEMVAGGRKWFLQGRLFKSRGRDSEVQLTTATNAVVT